jgi:nucleoside-diphosphate-sugar epimerase
VIYDGVRNHHEVVGTSRKHSTKYIQFDPFRDDWSLLGKGDVLVNCVGQIEATRASSFYHIHVDLTKLIIKNRGAIGNPKIIHVSALGASKNHKVEFLRTKGVGDDLLLQYPDTVVVRPSIVCTHRTMIIKKMLMLNRIARYTRGVVILPKGFLKTRIQPVMPQDLIDVVLALCTCMESERIVNVVGPLPLSFREIITMMFERDKKFRVLEIPKIITDAVVICFISVFFPGVVNSQQYQLLFSDNVADKREVEKILQRPLLSPERFFINEFMYATD